MQRCERAFAEKKTEPNAFVFRNAPVCRPSKQNINTVEGIPRCEAISFHIIKNIHRRVVSTAFKRANSGKNSCHRSVLFPRSQQPELTLMFSKNCDYTTKYELGNDAHREDLRCNSTPILEYKDFYLGIIAM